MNKKDLIKFEDEIVDLFNNGKIKSPVHLSGGNEEDLIEIFKQVKKDDWVFSTHRNHYHALLKSNNPTWLKRKILNGKSMHISSNRYKIMSGSIVGGMLPIALGKALAIKRLKGKEQVWCFIGEMAFTMGIAKEVISYAEYNDLPITFVMEDNKISCYTPTHKAWGMKEEVPKTIHYEYTRKYPHHGTGKFINF